MPERFGELYAEPELGERHGGEEERTVLFELANIPTNVDMA